MDYVIDRKTLGIIIGCIVSAAFFVFSDVAQSGLLGLLTHGMVAMMVFFHEIGHTVFSWIFGYPAFPMFDFQNGGGFSLHTERMIPVAILVFTAGAYVLYQIRKQDFPFFFMPLAAIWLGLAMVAFTDIHENIILFMGHGTEVVLGAFMLGRGVFNMLLLRPSERWLNVFVGSFFLLAEIKFCLALLHDFGTQVLYEAQKGGHRFGDLSRIADSHYGWTQDGVVIFLMMFTGIIIILILAVMLFLKKQGLENLN